MKSKKMVLVLAAFGCLLFAVSAQAGQELLDRVVAVVNDDVITQSELDGMLRPLYEQYMHDYSGETMMKMLAEAQDKLLNQLIEDRLVYQQAIKKKVEVTDAEIDSEMQLFKKRFGDQSGLEKALKSDNASLADLKDRIKRQALIRKLHDTEIRSKVVISPKEQEAYFAAHATDFDTTEQVRVSSLTIRKSDETREKGIADEPAQGRLAALRARVAKGEDFGKIVTENSEDKYSDQEGAGKWIKRGDMIPAVDEAIFKTSTGQMTDVIETPIGYHVFKIIEKQEKSHKTYEQVRDQIYEILFRQKSEERFAAWMETLKKGAYIAVKGKRI